MTPGDGQGCGGGGGGGGDGDADLHVWSRTATHTLFPGWDVAPSHCDVPSEGAGEGPGASLEPAGRPGGRSRDSLACLLRLGCGGRTRSSRPGPHADRVCRHSSAPGGRRRRGQSLRPHRRQAVRLDQKASSRLRRPRRGHSPRARGIPALPPGAHLLQLKIPWHRGLRRKRSLYR